MTYGGSRPGSGRKPDGDRARPHRLMLRLSDAELEVLRDACGRGPLSTWMRDAALEKAAGEDE